MIVVITDEAEADLERIGDYIAADNPRRAATFVQELLTLCRHLSDMPRAYPLVPRYGHTGVRRRTYGDYLIFYRINGDAIEVLHILNGAMNFEAILFPKP
jgi:plasmid stabilization system protein ParE